MQGLKRLDQRDDEARVVERAVALRITADQLGQMSETLRAIVFLGTGASSYIDVAAASELDAHTTRPAPRIEAAMTDSAPLSRRSLLAAGAAGAALATTAPAAAPMSAPFVALLVFSSRV